MLLGSLTQLEKSQTQKKLSSQAHIPKQSTAQEGSTKGFFHSHSLQGVKYNTP